MGFGNTVESCAQATIGGCQMFGLGVIGYGDSGNDFIKAAKYAEHWKAVCVGGRNMKKAGACGEKHGIPAVPVDEMVKRDEGMIEPTIRGSARNPLKKTPH